MCAVCAVTFGEDNLKGTGAECLPCPCGRWLHEHCAEDCRVSIERPYSVTSGSYDETSMQMAIATIEQQEMTMRHAAICYGIAPSTLHDRISEKVKEGATWGAVPYLTKQEVEEFASFLA